MQLFWGSNGTPANNAAVRSYTAVIQSRFGRPLRFITRLEVKADLFPASNTQASIISLENSWKGYLQTPYQDLILKADDGSTSGTCLINKTSLSGVRIIDGPNFTDPNSPNYVNLRTIEFTAEAEYVFPGAESLIVDFQESITFRGNGGPGFVWQFPFNAEAFPQQVSLQTMIVTIQKGRAVGHTKRPQKPKPFAGRPPGIFVNETEAGEDDSPESHGKGFVNYPTTWYYEYRSTKPLNGSPSLPPLAN